MTNYSRSVLKSNGPHRSKNLPVKFGFSSKTVPANIAKKLPLQRCFKPLLIALFNFSHKRPTFAFTSESGYTLGFRRKITHKGTHGETGGVLGGGWYHYPRSVPHVSETLRGQGVERQTLPPLDLGRGYSRRTQRAFGTAMRLCASLSRGVAAPLGCVIFFASAEIAVCTSCAQSFLCVRGMGGITTLGLFHTFRKLCVARCQNGKLCRFLVLAGCAPEERRKPSEQRCAYARRCSEASRPRWAA